MSVVYPDGDGWWEGETVPPPPADQWLWQVGDRWVATLGESEAEWFRDTDRDGTPTPEVRAYPIHVIPPAGTLAWRDETGAYRHDDPR